MALIAFFAITTLTNSNAMQSSNLDDLIELYELIDKYKPTSCNHKIVVKSNGESSLICIACEKNLLDGKSLHIIGRFGSDYHVHVVHEDCFEKVRNTSNPCPFNKCHELDNSENINRRVRFNLYSIVMDVICGFGGGVKYSQQENFIKIDPGL